MNRLAGPPPSFLRIILDVSKRTRSLQNLDLCLRPPFLKHIAKRIQIIDRGARSFRYEENTSATTPRRQVKLGQQLKNRLLVKVGINRSTLDMMDISHNFVQRSTPSSSQEPATGRGDRIRTPARIATRSVAGRCDLTQGFASVRAAKAGFQLPFPLHGSGSSLRHASYKPIPRLADLPSS